MGDLENYKGIYFGEEQSDHQKDPYNAQFRLEDLIGRLNVLKAKQDEEDVKKNLRYGSERPKSRARQSNQESQERSVDKPSKSKNRPLEDLYKSMIEEDRSMSRRDSHSLGGRKNQRPRTGISQRDNSKSKSPLRTKSPLKTSSKMVPGTYYNRLKRYVDVLDSSSVEKSSYYDHGEIKDSKIMKQSEIYSKSSTMKNYRLYNHNEERQGSNSKKYVDVYNKEALKKFITAKMALNTSKSKSPVPQGSKTHNGNLKSLHRTYNDFNSHFDDSPEKSPQFRLKGQGQHLKTLNNPLNNSSHHATSHNTKFHFVTTNSTFQSSTGKNPQSSQGATSSGVKPERKTPKNAIANGVKPVNQSKRIGEKLTKYKTFDNVGKKKSAQSFDIDRDSDPFYESFNISHLLDSPGEGRGREKRKYKVRNIDFFGEDSVVEEDSSVSHDARLRRWETQRYEKVLLKDQ